MPGRSYNFSEILKVIRRIIRAMDVHSKSLSIKSGITGPQLMILQEIQQHNTITTTKLAENISLSQSTVTMILDKLVIKKLVSKVRDNNDKRQWNLELSIEGKHISNELMCVLPESFMTTFPDLPFWQQNQIFATLQHIAEMMGE